MERLPVIFTRSPTPISWAIRAFTWSQWSHVGVVSADGRFVFEAKGRDGVVMTPIEQFKKRAFEWHQTTIPCENRAAAYRFYRSQLGKPYDVTGVFSIALRRDWQESDAWFCSEFVAAPLGLFRRQSIRHITPECIWRVSE